MSFLSDLGLIDIRDRLPRRAWIIGEREATTSLTWHWNGPAVHPERQHGAGLIEQLHGLQALDAPRVTLYEDVEAWQSNQPLARTPSRGASEGGP